KTFKNGVLSHTFNGSGNIGDVFTSSNDLRIGGRQIGSEPFAGLIDEVRVWSTAVADSAILANMSSVLDPSANPSLAGYWRFEEGAGLTATDATANHSDGSLGGISVP